MKTTDEVIKAFAELPSEITAKQIAEATGRTHIHNWTDTTKGFEGFPEARLDGRTAYRDKQAVLEWYLNQPFAQPTRRGPRDLTDAVRTANPGKTHLGASQLGELLGISRRAVNKYADHYSPEKTSDPFPAADSEGMRSWSLVRAWLLRHSDPLPKPDANGKRTWPDVRAWLLRNHEDSIESRTGSVFLDELGLTVGQRDLVERVRVAKAAGEKVPAEWQAEVLGLEDVDEAERLAQGLAAPARRLRPTALARELGISVDTVKHYAKTRTKETSKNPFPAKDDDSARDLEEVRAWFANHQK
ncbi:hypothetical protein [Streptomyces sp. NPDC055912]|uniref:hypothetical protein n=1 Tax=Streptomyces sp. NPDC055912 TaxID=3345660 RepID=UPI0035DF2FA8